MSRVLVTGSRDLPIAWGGVIYDRLARYPAGTVVIEGGATGADAYAARAARVLGFELIEVPAEWGNPPDPKQGPIRNAKMLEHRPDIVLAFTDGPLTRGTGNMVALARKAGVPVEHRGSLSPKDPFARTTYSNGTAWDEALGAVIKTSHRATTSSRTPGRVNRGTVVTELRPGDTCPQCNGWRPSGIEYHAPRWVQFANGDKRIVDCGGREVPASARVNPPAMRASPIAQHCGVCGEVRPLEMTDVEWQFRHAAC